MLIVGYIHDDHDVCMFTYIDSVSTEDYSLLPRQHIEQCGGEPEQADTGILCIILLMCITGDDFLQQVYSG